MLQRFEWPLVMPLERELRRELQLPRVQHRSGCPKIRAWVSWNEHARRGYGWRETRPACCSGYRRGSKTANSGDDQAVRRRWASGRRCSLLDSERGSVLVAFWNDPAAKNR